jgi:mono/diheme cytochrome c family protein
MPVRPGLPLALAALAAFVAGGTIFGDGLIPGRSGESEATRLRGKVLHDLHCASCHGAQLEGQPNWTSPLPSGRLPAPPHDASGHTWHHADDVLIGITLHGLAPYAGEGYESDMPAFADTLTRQDAADILTYIRSTWPERERAHQKRVTEQGRASQPGDASKPE